MIRHERAAAASLPRVVVLGASGFIGRHLVDHLTDTGVAVVPISSSKIDLSEPGAVDALGAVLLKDDALVFASCITRDRGEDPGMFTRNVAMAQHVGAFLERDGSAHVVYLSSDAVYAESAGSIREDAACDPAGLYGLAHVARERMLAHSAAKADVPLLTLRLCAVYGPGDTHHSYGPNRFLQTATRTGEIVLFGGGEETRDHIHVDDVCRVITQALARRSTGVANVATGTVWSFADVAEAVRRTVARPVEVRSAARRVPVTHRRLDVGALRAGFPELSFTPLEKGLQMTWQKGGGLRHA